MFHPRHSRYPNGRRPNRPRRLAVEPLEARYAFSAAGLAAAAPAALVTDPAAHQAAAPAAEVITPDVNVPTDFAGTPVSSTSVQLTWTADGSALGYLIYEFEGDQAVQIGSVNGSTGLFGVSGLQPSTDYAFNLVAFDATSSSATAWIGVGTLAGLTPPGNFTGSRLSDTQVQLSWTATPGATGYNLFEFENNQPTLISTLSSAATSTTVSNLSPNTTYAFNLVAFDSTDLAATPWISVSTAPLLPPGNFSGQGTSDTQVQLTWTNSVSATGYNLFQFENNMPVLIATYGAGTTSATLNGLTANTTYAFNLVAVNATGTAATAWIGVTTLAPLLPPANFSGMGTSSSQISLQWSAAAGATGYNLYEFEAGAPLLINTFPAGTTSTIVNSLSPGTTYAFNLVAFNATQSAATAWIGVSTTA